MSPYRIGRHAFAAASLFVAAALLGACATQPPIRAAHTPAEVRAQLVHLLPATVRDRKGWANDIETAFSTLEIEPSAQNLCATLAVTEQESGYAVDPVVPNLGRIARAEIDRRAASHHVPAFVVRGALALDSPDGKSWNDRIAAVRSERELSLIYEEMIGRIPLGQRLFADSNPVRTGGPMQVAVAFAEAHAREHDYPYPRDGSIRHEVFTRRGGLYFGIAHLLGHPTSYERMIYRFADFNAGIHASRNAAFQNAVAIAGGTRLALDGDLVDYGGDGPGATERAVRALGLDLDPSAIRRALERGADDGFERSALWRDVFARAERKAGHPLPGAMLPRIALESPKITRKLTTAWFAQRVDQRYARCLARITWKDRAHR